jgi:Holliday junction resolvase-like predicted endonuclease
MTLTPIDLGEDSNLPWFWEGNVQAQVAKFLIADGWTIVTAANTASRQRGIDLVATKGDRRLAVEVKGFPGTVYARGERAGQPKPTAPNLQARHWLAEALLAVLLLGGSSDQGEIGLAFPDVPRYRELVGRIKYAIDRLGLRVFFAKDSGHVTELENGIASKGGVHSDRPERPLYQT